MLINRPVLHSVIGERLPLAQISFHSDLNGKIPFRPECNGQFILTGMECPSFHSCWNVIYHTSKQWKEQLFRGRKRCSFPSFDVWYHIINLVGGTGKPMYFSFLCALCCQKYFWHQTAGQENLCIFHSSPALCCQKYMQVFSTSDCMKVYEFLSEGWN